ncbi:MAG: hypothetical protein NW241_17080 [Bacteroidia bacterium]|nr:hypothetical protein [Bacteroidia bacterium]
MLFAGYAAACTPRLDSYRPLRLGNSAMLSVPEGLQPVSDLNEDAPLQLADPAREIFAVFRSSDWEALRRKRPYADLEDYYDFHLENLLIDLRSTLAPSPDTVRLGGMMALSGWVTGDYKGDSLTYRLVVIESEQRLYQGLIWMTPESWRRYHPQMDSMLRSIRELP